MQAITDTIRFPDELGALLREHRKAKGFTKKTLAERSGKVREVVYRLEAGEDITVSSLFAVLRAMGLTLRVEQSGMPTMEEVRARFDREEDDF